jgi:hypothetical protein
LPQVRLSCKENIPNTGARRGAASVTLPLLGSSTRLIRLLLVPISLASRLREIPSPLSLLPSERRARRSEGSPTAASAEDIRGNGIHRLLVIVRFEQMPVAVHRHLEAAVTGESLDGLGAQVRLDPA